jgi:hypothetical protein
MDKIIINTGINAKKRAELIKAFRWLTNSKTNKIKIIDWEKIAQKGNIG